MKKLGFFLKFLWGVHNTLNYLCEEGKNLLTNINNFFTTFKTWVNHRCTFGRKSCFPGNKIL